MISDVVLVGLTLENLERGFRYVDVRSTDILKEKTVISKIPVLYWTKEDFTKLNKYKYGTKILVRGRIESDEEIGLYVLAESIYLFNC